MAIQAHCDSPTPVHLQARVRSIQDLTSEVFGTAILLQHQVQTLENLAYATSEREATLRQQRAKLQELLRLVTTMEMNETRATATLKEALAQIHAGRLAKSFQDLSLSSESPSSRTQSPHVRASDTTPPRRHGGASEDMHEGSTGDANGSHTQENGTEAIAAGAIRQSGSSDRHILLTPYAAKRCSRDSEDVTVSVGGQAGSEANLNTMPAEAESKRLWAQPDPLAVGARSPDACTRAAAPAHSGSRVDPRLPGIQVMTAHPPQASSTPNGQVKAQGSGKGVGMGGSWRARQETPPSSTPSPCAGRWRERGRGNMRGRGAASSSSPRASEANRGTSADVDEQQEANINGSGRMNRYQRHTPSPKGTQIRRGQGKHSLTKGANNVGGTGQGSG